MTPLDQVFRHALIITLATYLLAGLFLIVVGALLARLVVRAHGEYSGTRTVTCPETEDYAHVKVDAWHAAMMRLLGRTHLRVRDCSRWPERRDCAQACTWQMARNRKA